MTSLKQAARIMQAADRDARPWSDDMDDADLYGRAARQAEQHLADMRRNDPERYAMLQAEWEACR